MKKAFPEEFRRDIVAVALRKEAPLSQVRATSGSLSCACTAGSSDRRSKGGLRDGLTLGEEAEIRVLKKRNRPLEQENEVLRRAAIYLGGVNPK